MGRSSAICKLYFPFCEEMRTKYGQRLTEHPIFCRLQILAFFMLTGVASTLLIKETNQKTLEDLSNERQDAFVMGECSNNHYLFYSCIN